MSQQEIVDTEHLRLLRLGFFISAATNVIWVFFPLMYVVMGAFMLSGLLDDAKPSEAPPRVMGLVLVVIGLGISLIAAAFAVLKLLAAQAIGKRQRKGLIFTTAIISCLSLPWGTALGVLTLIVLSRPSVAAQFEGVRQPPHS